MQNEMSIEYHNHYADGCHKRANNLDATQTFGLVKQGDKGRGEQRAHTHDEGCVRGGGVVHRAVLGEEIKRAARDAQSHHKQLVPDGCRHQTKRFLRQREAEQQNVCDDETDGEDVGCRETAQQQQFSEDERGAPDDHYYKGHQVIKERGRPPLPPRRGEICFRSHLWGRFGWLDACF